MRGWHWGTIIIIAVVIVIAYHFLVAKGGAKGAGPAATQNA